MYNFITKKYFLMYLPVYDKIPKIGEHCWFKNVDGFHARGIYEKDGYVHIIHGSHPEYNGECKAELFIVTKDIQIGDCATERLTTGEFDQFEIHDLNDIDLNNQVKIIGKPSTEAIWIYEFNEFSEDEIETGGGHILYYTDKMNSWSKTKDKDFEYVKLKCKTCNTFH